MPAPKGITNQQVSGWYADLSANTRQEFPLRHSETTWQKVPSFEMTTAIRHYFVFVFFKLMFTISGFGLHFLKSY